MIKKSILATILMVISYEFCIRFFDVSWTAGQNQWQSNIIRANDFLYSDVSYSNVMVGSSIANRITSKAEKDSLPGDFYSLAFNGQSAFDGLLILKNMGHIPKRLFIESNIVMRNEDVNFQETLFSPVLYPTKRYLKSWRERYQPVEVISRFLSGKRLNAEHTGLFTSKLVRDEKAYQINLNVQIGKNQKAVDAHLLNAQINKLRQMITHFQERGSEVILFEVPLDPAMCGLAAPVQARAAVEAAFMPMNCKFIKIPDCGDYYTTDGTHLADISIYKYLNYFRQELAKE